MVGTAFFAVHLGRRGQRRHPDFPQGLGRCQRVAITCAQIAIMPRNNASEARAAASAKPERNIASSQERRGNDVHILFVGSRKTFVRKSHVISMSWHSWGE